MVGLSANPSRPSYRAAVHMLAYGYDVVPVNPNVDIVLGQRAVPSLHDVEGPLGIVDVFRRIEEVPRVVEEALEVGCAAVWLQLGLISPGGRGDVPRGRRAVRAGPVREDGALPLVRRAELGRPRPPA